METVWTALQHLGQIGGAVLSAGFVVYFIPNSPVRRAVEAWIERRVSYRFDKELETYRHRLTLDAERVRTEHQRLLHNAALVTERKHEVYRELFKLIHIANGRVGGLYGFAKMPTFEDYTIDDLKAYLDGLRMAGRTKEFILENWESNNKGALKELREAERRLSISQAEQAFKDAWNYYLMNSLYLDSDLSDAAAKIFEPLQKILAQANVPEAGGGVDVIKLKAEASELVEQLLQKFRSELRVADGDTPRAIGRA